jgi:hypothetical protein
MKVHGNFRLASDTQIAALHRRPHSIQAFLFGSDEEPTAVTGAILEVQVGEDWHALHALLMAVEQDEDEPLDFIVKGREVGTVDVGCGPARTFSSEQVVRIARALQHVDAGRLKKLYRPQELAQRHIVPSTWESLRGHFDELKELIAKGAEQKLGLVVYLT